MPQTITNQASLNFQYNGQSGFVRSNIATATLTEPITVTKNAIEDSYRVGDELTFAVSFINGGTTALTGVVAADDLGSYQVGAAQTVPLTFTAPALLYLNGVYSGTVSSEVTDEGVRFRVPSLAAQTNALIVYKVMVNAGASPEIGSQITNTVTISADNLSTPISDSHTVTAEEYAEVTVTKSMSPAVVVDGSTISYTFVINNYGNTSATDVVLTDTFNPAPENISVQINGDTVSASDYSYTNDVLTLPATSAAALSLPAATFTRDSTTGETTVTPSSLIITVTGTL